VTLGFILPRAPPARGRRPSCPPRPGCRERASPTGAAALASLRPRAPVLLPAAARSSLARWRWRWRLPRAGEDGRRRRCGAGSQVIGGGYTHSPPPEGTGWGDEITWVQTYEEGLYQAKKSNKPLMVIHHLEDCQYCQALKKAFAENEEIQEMAQNNFIMLNLMHETTDKNLSPDGQYVPRIMFVDPSLTVRADITGRYSNRLYTYEPQDMTFLIENMKKALRLIQTEL
uniref:Anterior gradient 3, protein disulphide isomerase family member n=1 Tax=Catharus ustulatus TaxID=91951 RepID=A0A8C3TKP5_CATUS